MTQIIVFFTTFAVHCIHSLRLIVCIFNDRFDEIMLSRRHYCVPYFPSTKPLTDVTATYNCLRTPSVFPIINKIALRQTYCPNHFFFLYIEFLCFDVLYVKDTIFYYFLRN